MKKKVILAHTFLILLALVFLVLSHFSYPSDEIISYALFVLPVFYGIIIWKSWKD